jgi:hypothetical protein
VRRLVVVGAVSAVVSAVPAAGVALADDPAAQGGGAVAEAAHASDRVPVTLRKGDRGSAVAKVQRKLRLKPDGVFGPLTHRAVRRFQRRKRLTVDGIVGPQTRRAMRLRPFSRSSVVHPRKRSRRSRGLPGLPPALVDIAECESGGDPTAVSSSGRYRGKYQFSRSTWKQWGGRGDDPAEASERHQDEVALKLYRARGTAPWPSCS